MINTSSRASRRIGITLGDPAGIGPEITVKALGALAPEDRSRVVVIGQPEAVERATKLADVRYRLISVDADDADRAAIRFAPIEGLPPALDGALSPEGGEAAYRAVKRGVELAISGTIGCIVTAPLNKAALHAAGHDFDGHTGLLAHLTGVKSSFMLLASERLNTIHVSTHVSLEEATRRATVKRVIAVIEAAAAHFNSLGMTAPRIAVAGLNPHCGEGGIFGRQEIETISPAVDFARAKGYDVEGPISGDTVFYRASRGAFDVVVAQYHDQGHIPIKLLAFDTAVNVTLGLPIMRTSVDHGTAFDIAWKGVADAGNMGCAIRYAFRMIDGAAGRSR